MSELLCGQSQLYNFVKSMESKEHNFLTKTSKNPQQQVICRLYELRALFPEVLNEAVLVISSTLMMAIHEEFFKKILDNPSYKTKDLPKISKIKFDAKEQVNFIDCTNIFLTTDEGLSLTSFLYVLGSVKRCKFLFLIGHNQAESAGIKSIVTLFKTFFSIIKQNAEKILHSVCMSVGIVIPDPHENKSQQFYIKKAMGGMLEPNFLVHDRSNEILSLTKAIIDKKRLVLLDGKNEIAKIMEMLGSMKSIDTEEMLHLQKINQKITVNGVQVPLQVNYTVPYFTQFMEKNLQLLTTPELGYSLCLQISSHVKRPNQRDEKHDNILVKKPAFIIRNLIRFLRHLTNWVSLLTQIGQKECTLQFEIKTVKQIYHALVECQMLPKPHDQKKDYVEQYFIGAYDIYSRVMTHFNLEKQAKMLLETGVKANRIVEYQPNLFFECITKDGKGLLPIENLLLKLSLLVSEELSRPALASEQYKENASILEQYIPIYKKFCLIEGHYIEDDWKKDRNYNNIRKAIAQMRYLYLRHGDKAQDFKLFFDAAEKSHLLEARLVKMMYLLLAKKLQRRNFFQEAIECYLQGDKVGSAAQVIRVYASGLKVSLNGLKVISKKDFKNKVKHYLNLAKRLLDYGLIEQMRDLIYECISACNKFAMDEDQTEVFKSILLKGGDRWELSSHCRFLQTELSNRSNEAIKKDLLGKQNFLQSIWKSWDVQR